MHNTLMRFTAECMRLCLIFRIPMTGENPRSSRFWLLPACPMSFAGVFLSLEKLLPYQCLGSKRVCANSGRPHVPLAGQSQDGAFVTASAEHYPDHLCRLLASCFLDLELQLTAESIEYY